MSFLHIFHILSLNIHTVWNLTLRSKVINILHSKLMLFVGRWHYLLAYSNRRTLRRLPFEFSGGWFFRCKVIYFQLFRSRFFRAKTSYIFTTPLITAIDPNIYFHLLSVRIFIFTFYKDRKFICKILLPSPENQIVPLIYFLEIVM